MGFDQRKNVTRGCRKLIVWQDAIEFHVQTCGVFRGFPLELKRIASQQIASSDSIHRNIAEGYCRRSLKEYLQYPNIALSSAGESVFGLHAYRSAGQISAVEFERLDCLAYRVENRMKRLIERLQVRNGPSAWSESFIVEESNGDFVIRSDDLNPGIEDRSQRSDQAVEVVSNA